MSAVVLKVPALGESVTEAVIAKWKVAEGDAVKADEPVVEVESEKATVEVPSPGTGVLKRILRNAGETVAIGEVIAEVEIGATAASASANANEVLEQGDGRAVKASPAMRRLMHERDVVPTDVQGTGPRGRIVREDVMRAVEDRQEDRQSPPSAVMAKTTAPTMSIPGAPEPVVPRGAPAPKGQRPERVVPMSPMRRTVARRLLEAQQNAAILTTFNEINMAEVMTLRERYQEQFQKRHGIKLGFMSFFVKAAVDALKAFPIVNAEVRGNDIVYKDFYDIGIAVGGGRGLVVPVVRNADRLSLAEVERGIAELGVKARENKLRPDDLEGGTFTISNGGIYGSMLSTPILNPPQSGILGLHAIQKRPVAVGEAIALRPMMYVALSYDHRIVDGREAVQFLVRIKECIEDPERILIEV